MEESDNANMLISQTSPVQQASVPYTVVFSSSQYLRIKIVMNKCPCNIADLQEFKIAGPIRNPDTTKVPSLTNTLTS